MYNMWRVCRMNKSSYQRMLSALEKQRELNKNKVYPEVKHYPRRFDILDPKGEPVARFYFANLTEGYRYVNDKGGMSKEYVPFDVVRDCFKYFKVSKFN